MRERLLSDSLTDAAQDLAHVKQQNLRLAILTAAASVAWVAVLLWETWAEISQSFEQCIAVFFIFFFVFFNVSNRMVKIHRTTTSLLRQIEEVKKG